MFTFRHKRPIYSVVNRYQEEVKSLTAANYLKLAVPIIFPLYLACQIYDWVMAPQQALTFLLIRLSIVPPAALFYAAFRGKWKGDWHVYAVWILSFFVSLQLVLMAQMAPNPSGYLIGISMMSGVFLLLFPLPFQQNLMTAVSLYMPLGVYWVVHLREFGTNFSLNFQAAGMGIVFLVTSSSLDKLRHQTFKQKNELFLLATTDTLSGLKLRRYFFTRFIQELSLQFRKKEDLFSSVAMIDIDHFKQINDRHGHQAGDRCIRHLGGIIQRNIRIYDVACRFGGEEFVILFPAAQISEAGMICERIRKAVESSTLMMGRTELKLKISIGISGIAPDLTEDLKRNYFNEQKKQRAFLIKSIMRVIKEADAALYEAKRKGKNRIVLGEPADFLREVSQEEEAVLKQYTVYFEQDPSLFLETPFQDDFGKDVYYPADFFFRRCVEGLYRHCRNPEWEEMLAVIRIAKADSKLIQKNFGTFFRLSDAVSLLEDDLAAVLFVGMPAEMLPKLYERVQAKITAISGLENTEIKIAAALLRFEDGEWLTGKSRMMSHEQLTRRTEELFAVLKRHHFRSSENFFYYQPGRPRGLKQA